MAELRIAHHERVPGDGHRWRVHIDGRSRPVTVELAPEDRQELELSDEELHALLPTALQRHLEANPGALPDETAHDVAWDAPVRVLQTHFIG
jgi:hypothetical protein